MSGAESTSAQTAAPVPAWQYTLTDGAACGLGLSDDGETLVAVVGFGFDPGGQIVSLDPATGAELWRVAIPNGIDLDLNQASPPLIAGNQIFVRDEIGGVVALALPS